MVCPRPSPKEMKRILWSCMVILLVSIIYVGLGARCPWKSSTKSGSSAPTTSAWTTKAPMPTARASLAIGVVNNPSNGTSKIYAIAGWGECTINEEYDPVSDSWRSRAYMPTGRANPAIGVVNNPSDGTSKIYVIGGLGYDHNIGGPAYITPNEEYDPVSDTWTTKANLPTKRSGFAWGVVNNKIYIIGGGSIGTLNEEYDPASDTWTTKSPMPTARYGLAIGVVNNKIYAIGGADSNDNVLNTNEEYNPISDTWTTKSPMPTARGSIGIGVVNNPSDGTSKIYAIGGSINVGDAVTTIEVYDPASDIWTTKAPMPAKRALSAIGVVNNKIYIIGGYSVTEGVGSDSALNEEYSPE